MAVSPVLERIAVAWRSRVGVAARQVTLVLVVLAFTAGAHLARRGTTSARVTTGLLVALAVGVMLARWLRDRRDYRDARRTIAKVLVPSDRELGQRALRAVGLLARTASGPQSGSPVLAELHFQRLLARAAPERVVLAADRRASRLRLVLLGLLAAVVASFAVGPMRVLEGLDVLAAYRGRGPLPMAWLDEMRVTAEPPGYLRLPERPVFVGLHTRQPQGTLLTVHGKPRREGRQLVLTDGEREVPFVADGSGGVVARFTVERSTEVEVAARFGDVLIPELDGLMVTAVPDQPPEVVVEEAPRTVELGSVDEVAIHYDATDDHGLRQIELVLRAGEREDRRVLSRLDGERTFERGAHTLAARDPFLRRMFLPVLVTIEARDNDPVHGPKWGASAPITLVPPLMGAPEAARFVALAEARAQLVALLAAQMRSTEDEPARSRRAADAVRTVLGKTFGGLAVPAGLGGFLRGQMQVLERPLRPGEQRVRRTEDVVLAFDVALRALGTRDAQSVSKRLAEVVEEIADGAKQARETEKREVGVARVDAASKAAIQGAEQLTKLGALGQDLGAVATADLGRVRRARAAEDLGHTELAARHLAARLRRPNPSFGSARVGGVESGAPGLGEGQAGGEPSDASQRFDELAAELERLVNEHGDEIGKVEQALADAERGVDLEGLREEAKQRADAIRQAVADLPLGSPAPGSARASASLGREHGGSMAQSLERLSLADAVQSGQSALAALDEAEKKSKDRASVRDYVDPEALGLAKKTLRQELAWAEKKLDELRKSARERARGALQSSGGREQALAQRAGNLAARGKLGETALPESSVDDLERAESIMREASRALSEGRGERGLELQREAQRLLERSDPGRTGEDDEPPPSDPKQRPQRRSDGRRDIATGGDVPGEDDSKRAEDFRKRVLQGLGQAKDGRLAPAVKRYAEGLLR